MKKPILLAIFTLILFTSGIAQNVQKQNRTRKPAPTKTIEEAEKTMSPEKSSSSGTKATSTKATTTSTTNENFKSKPYKKPFDSDKTWWFTQIDFEGEPVSTDIDYFNIYGNLTANFFIGKLFYLGPTFNYKYASTTDYQVMAYDGKNIDVASLNEWGAGLNVGFDFFDQTRVIMSPELRTSFSQYNMQDVAYNDSNKLFINHNYICINPRLNLGVRISDYSSIGITGGYKIAAYIKGEKNNIYNPQTFNLGLFFRFSLAK